MVVVGLGFTPRQDYFTNSEPGQSLGGAKTGDPQEKSPDHPQAELSKIINGSLLKLTGELKERKKKTQQTYGEKLYAMSVLKIVKQCLLYRLPQ